MARDRDSARLAVVLLAVSIFLLGIWLAVLPLLPFEWVKFMADSQARDGSADFLTAEFHRHSARPLWGASGLLVLTAAALFVFKESLTRFHKPLVQSSIRMWWDLVDQVRPSFQKGHLAFQFVLILLFVAGIWLRAFFLSDPIRNFDEAYMHNFFSSKPFLVILTDYHVPNNHVFYSFLVHIATLSSEKNHGSCGCRHLWPV